MAGEIVRPSNGVQVAPRGTARAVARIAGSAQTTQAVIRAKSRVGEFAVNEVVELKAVQRELEQRNPDAGDAIALIVNSTVLSIARSVSQYCGELD